MESETSAFSLSSSPSLSLSSSPLSLQPILHNRLIMIPKPNRNEMKVHNCVGMFAKCQCNVSPSNTSTGAAATSASTTNNNTRSSQDAPTRRKTFFQSYSHPDTSFVFTDDNKSPPRTGKNPVIDRFVRSHSTSPRTKRLSHPNFGNYTVLDVAVHPEVVLTVSHTNGQIEPRYAEPTSVEQPNLILPTHSKRILKKSITFDNESSDGFYNAVRYNEWQHERPRPMNKQLPLQKQSMDSSSPPSSTKNRKDIFETPYGPINTDSPLIQSRAAPRKASRVEQLRSYSKLRKQSECDEEEYLKIQYKKHLELEDEVLRLNQIITERDEDINKLKREIHKLKSVLQQTHGQLTPPALPRTEGDLLSSIQTHHRMATAKSNPVAKTAPTDNQQQLLSSTSGRFSSDPQATLQLSSSSLGTTLQLQNNGISQNQPPSFIIKHPQILNLSSTSSTTATTSSASSSSATTPTSTAVKKQGVSGESSDASSQMSRDIKIPKYDKDFRSKQLIKDAIMENDFLKNIDSSQVRELVDSMYSRSVNGGEYVICEGDAGAHLFVSAEGDFEVIKDGKVLGRMGPGKAFGELAILYNCTRTASIKVLTNSKVWVLDRRVFQQIMMRTGMQRIEENINFLRSVPLLKNLSNNLLAKIADVLEVEFYTAGAYVIRQGASGDTFFLISQGTVKVTQRFPGSNPTIEEDIRTLSRGDYFGEQALLKEDKRTANIIAMPPGVECLTLDRKSFNQLIGDLCELHEKDYGDESRVLAMKRCESKGLIQFWSNTKQELLDVELNSLDIVATLGIGGFGRVELVKHKKNGEIQTYALKCLKKQHIVDTRQEEHVFSERTIMLACKSPFICRLYRTYRDDRYVYMLLEACMGGEVWTILRDHGYFDDSTAQFIIGCVLLAFEYLHKQGIVYRDLKPENLMLDERGYIKLVDFGFSKSIGYSSKTWTFCGTPEYVAPEIILNKGHDRAVDYWALGILIHELLTGTPPFTGNDPMKTYNLILRGIDLVDFPKHMSRAAILLIKLLCRDIPVERLGYQRGGTQDIKKHKWFQNFDWDGLANLSIIPPLLQSVTGPLDISNFDNFPAEYEVPPIECSGWDEGF